MFKWFKKIFATPIEEAAEAQGSATDDENTPQGDADQYLTDQPISSKAEDRFNRAKFASRIAETMVLRRDPSSLVLGLYGPWGDGKTSVLEMMQETLETYDDVVVVRFNPWHFQNEDSLLRGFFATLADAVGRSLPNLKEKAGDLIKKYGSVLSLASFTIGGVVELKPGDSAVGLGEAMSNVGLDELRRRIEGMLGEAGKRLVILIDDIDRLDRDETHAVFKLVKLSASFKYTAYALAFDDGVVAAALGERYGAGGSSAGRAFLEKIVQVPLHLPPVDLASLRRLCLEGIIRALEQADITLTKQQLTVFVTHFDQTLLEQLQTPRRAKLYSNAVMFALPILKGEVNPTDLMLIEGIRVIHPLLYAAIRDNPSMFLRREQQENGVPRRVEALIEESTPTLTDRERSSLRRHLLEPLFPRLGRSEYGGSWETTWESEQKVCSQHYFKRYFTYSVPVGDVPDADVELFCATASGADFDALQAQLQSFAARSGLPRVVSRLIQRLDSLTPGQAGILSIVLAASGPLYPREQGMLIALDTRGRFAALISSLIEKVPAGEQRLLVAESVIKTASPIGYAAECFNWIRHNPEKPAEDRILSEANEDNLRRILTEKIASEDSQQPIFLSASSDAPILYWHWANGASIEHVRTTLRAWFERTPEDIDVFLSCFIRDGWMMETGLPASGFLVPETYESIVNLIDGQYIADNLRLRHGAELDAPSDYPPMAMDQPKRLAHLFVSMHLRMRETSNG